MSAKATTASTAKTAGNGAAKGAAAASSGGYKFPENHVGYVTESKAGNRIIKVEQDITLSKGDVLFLAPRDEESNTPTWISHKVNKIVKKD